MSLKANFRIAVLGFVLGYCGVMGSLGAAAYGEPGRLAIKFVLIPLVLVGAGLTAVSKFSRVSH
jgi:hypothetical protein